MHTYTEVKGRYKIAKAKTAAERDVVRALECFLNTAETKARFNHYFVDGPELCYRTVVSRNGQMELVENTIAKKVGNTILGNSSALDLIGRSSRWGRERQNTAETEIQRRLALCVPMLPFSVFEQANLDLDAFTLIERGPEETVTRKHDTGKRDKKTDKPIIEDETAHFTGASLFSIEGTCFLFDVDRRELKHKVFNPFLVKLPAMAASISEAYELLKPEVVKKAIAMGLKVKRQGEFFFIPVTKADAKRLDALKDQAIPLELRAGQNRPNSARGLQFIDGQSIKASTDWQSRSANRELIAKAKTSECFVTGKVSHTGREHADLILTGWYVAYPNTATESFTITGDID